MSLPVLIRPPRVVAQALDQLTVRHRWGRSLDAEACRSVLRLAPQPLRHVAAWDLAAITGAPLLPAAAPARRQRRLLAAAPFAP